MLRLTFDSFIGLVKFLLDKLLRSNGVYDLCFQVCVYSGQFLFKINKTTISKVKDGLTYQDNNASRVARKMGLQNYENGEIGRT